MKQVVITSLLILLSEMIYSQDGNEYIIAMVNQKKALKTAVTEKDFQELANNFERIATKETDKWHPLYYAALCYINKSFACNPKDEKDAGLDKAQTMIEKAFEIHPEESELWVLQGLLYQGRIQIEPIKRGKEFSAKAALALKKAQEFNPENPRAYYLLGLNVLHTPKAIGGGTEAACSIFKQASEKFTKYVPEHVLSPTWGGEENDKLYNENCLKSK